MAVHETSSQNIDVLRESLVRVLKVIYPVHRLS